jgi:hypothetical protein
LGPGGDDKLIEAFLEWALLQSWLIGAPLVTFVGLMSIPAFRNTATSPTDRAYWLKLLRDDRPAERYRSVMGGWLDWLDTRLSAYGRNKARRKGLGASACSLLPWVLPFLSNFGHHGPMACRPCD